MSSKKIPPSCYSRDYFFCLDWWREEFERFKKGGKLGRIYLQALKHIPKDVVGPFLDVGCGRGEMVIYLGRQGKRAYGVDYSPAAIKICQETLSLERKSVRSLSSFKLADCTKLPFKDHAFQCLFLLDVVEHLTPRQLQSALKEAKRVLKKGGVIIVHTNNKYFEKIAKFLIAFSYHGAKFPLPPGPYEELHINYLTGDQLALYLEKMGFETEVEYTRPKNKTELRKYLPYSQRWKRFLFYPLAWFFINSSLIKFLSPTFWLVARKNN